LAAELWSSGLTTNGRKAKRIRGRGANDFIQKPPLERMVEAEDTELKTMSAMKKGAPEGAPFLNYLARH
jgi:hypothetical protein